MENAQMSKGFLSNMEFNRFGVITVVLLVVGCLGGFAVGLGAVEEYWSLAFIVVPTMATLALLLAVAPMKQIITSGIIACVIDFLFIGYFLLT